MSRQIVDSDDEEEEGESSESVKDGTDTDDAPQHRPRTNGHSSSKAGKKRAREDDGDDRMDGEAGGEATLRDTLCSDGFHVGSIISITLQNFMTYDFVDFSVGPNLNMVIGANGTGKSSIVSAIALGLAYKTNVLGRATDFKDYVKNGQSQGSISITLRRNKSLKNVTIKRTISGTANKSTWQIDSTWVTQREVQDLVKNLNIQIDSLCSFLPQEKVVEFAKLSPAELLVETQRTVGSRKMAERHKLLQELKKSLIDHEAKLTESQNELDRLEAHNESVGREVERYQDRVRITKELAVLELTVLSAEYAEAKAAWTEHKVLYQAAREALRKMTLIEDPTKVKQKRAMVLVNKYAAKMEEIKGQLKKTDEKERQTAKSIQANIAKSEAKTSALKALRAREQKRKEVVINLRRDIALLEDELSTPIAAPDQAVYREKMNDLADQITEISGKAESLKDQRQGLADSQKQTLMERQDKVRQIDALDDVRKRRLEDLRGQNSHIADVVDWLRSNRDQFKGRVFEPICLEINVTDPRYAAAVEAAINATDMTTFVCEEDEDYRAFARLAIDQMHKRVNISSCRTKTQVPEGLGTEVLRSIGFDGNLIDFIDAPEPVLQYLKVGAGIHRIPVGLGRIDPEVAARANLNKYISGDSLFNVKYSRYGQRLPQTLQRALRPPRILSDAVNVSQKQILERERDMLQEKLTTTEGEVSKINAQLNRLNQEDSRLREQRNELKQEKNDAMKPYLRYQKAQTHLQSLKDNLENEMKRPERFTDERAALKTTLEEATREAVDLASAYYQLVCDKVEMMEKHLQTVIEQHQIKSAHDQWVEDRKTNDSAVGEAENRLTELAAENAKMKEAAMAIYNNLRELQGKAEPDSIRAYEADPKTTPLAELQNHQTDLQARLELIVAPTSGVVRAFENRQVQIEELKASVATLESKVADQKDQVEEVHNEWYPALTSLITRISTEFEAAFDRIGCAGAVRLANEDQEYSKWGIEILVKFRDNEALQSLTAQRQSGGERSVSTILYLMSLQELAKAPFRVVDEINQGMDPRNERLVHSQMVAKACKAGTSQYFLITPKLLPDLDYHERMTVLCVYNGDWLPENSVSLTSLVSAKKAVANGRQTNGSGRQIEKSVTSTSSISIY